MDACFIEQWLHQHMLRPACSPAADTAVAEPVPHETSSENSSIPGHQFHPHMLHQVQYLGLHALDDFMSNENA